MCIWDHLNQFCSFSLWINAFCVPAYYSVITVIIVFLYYPTFILVVPWDGLMGLCPVSSSTLKIYGYEGHGGRSLDPRPKNEDIYEQINVYYSSLSGLTSNSIRGSLRWKESWDLQQTCVLHVLMTERSVFSCLYKVFFMSLIILSIIIILSNYILSIKKIKDNLIQNLFS